MFEDIFAQGGLSLDRLRSFCEVAGAGGMAKAAGGDSVRQSQYSRQVRELEEFFGVELTARHGRNIVLTAAGEELAAVGREVLGALSDFRKTKRGEAVELRIGAGESLIQWLIMPRIAALRGGLVGVIPSMRNLRSREIVDQVASGDLDIGIVREDAVGPRLERKRIGVLRYALFVAPSSGQRARKPGWRDVLKKPIVGLEGEGQLNTAFRSAALEVGLELQPVVQCSSMPAVAIAIRALDGVAILPEIAAAGDLVAVDAPFLREFDRQIVVTWNQRQASIRAAVERGRNVLATVLRW